MPITRFPDPRDTDENGILAFGGDLHPESLDLAYRQGIFPWPIEGLPLAWFCPPERAVLEFKDLHIPRSLARAKLKAQNQWGWTYSIDRAFDQVISECAKAPRPGQDGTWITAKLLRGYRQYHRYGRAHSVEVWEGPAGTGELVGRIYGVEASGAFAGESMFYRKPYASKLALLHLIEHLRSKGLQWLDIQMLTPHMEALGAKTISRDEFLEKLARTQALGLRLFEPPHPLT